MRSIILKCVLGYGLVAAAIAPAIACPYQSSSNDKPPQQTAQAQSPDSKTQ